MSISAGIPIYALLILLTMCFEQHLAVQLETYKASQCFKSRGIPKVDFTCEPNHMIRLVKAFHGIAVPDRKVLDVTNECQANPGHTSTNCTYCPGDCVDDSMNLVYDWSTCMGNTTCSRTVMQSYMPTCRGKDKFSDYLQVDYQCLPRSSVIDICSSVQDKWINEAHIISPNYPDNYPQEYDCLCNVFTEQQSKLVIGIYDLLLETKNGRCRADWLMVRQGSQRHRHCGAIMTGNKNLTIDANSIQLQFHSDNNNNVSQNFQYFNRKLKGFWIYISADPPSSMRLSCRRLNFADAEVQEIYKDDAGFESEDEETSFTATVKKISPTPDVQIEGTFPPSDTNEVQKKNKGGKKSKQKERGSAPEANYQEGDSAKASASHHINSHITLYLTSIILIASAAFEQSK